MTKQYTPRYGLCIDWETSGADFGKDSSKKYQGLTYGAIIFDAATFEEIESIYVEIKFDATKYQWSQEAERIHGKTREYLEKNGVTQEEAAIKLAEMILKYWGPSRSTGFDPASKVMFLGHNPEFDKRFTRQLMNAAGLDIHHEQDDHSKQFDSRIDLHHVTLDTSALGFITLGLYKSDLLFERIGFEKRGAHNALDDARMTLQTCAAIRSLVELGLQQ